MPSAAWEMCVEALCLPDPKPLEDSPNLDYLLLQLLTSLPMTGTDLLADMFCCMQ
jgi:hypothetical protein